jgi:hypothetical protein
MEITNAMTYDEESGILFFILFILKIKYAGTALVNVYKLQITSLKLKVEKNERWFWRAENSIEREIWILPSSPCFE